MKKSFIKTIATLALGMMIGSATIAAAAPSTVQAVLAKFTLSVNGQHQALKNEPLVYNGTTYLPVREVAGLLDADASFDNKTKNIELQTKGVDTVDTTVPVSQEWISLADLAKQVDELTAGPLSDNQTGLTIVKGDVKVEIPNLIGKPDGTVETLKTSTGVEIKVKFSDYTTYLPVETLKTLKVLP